jgi:dienelactone hydrolase
MKTKLVLKSVIFCFIMLTISSICHSKNPPVVIKEKMVKYTADGKSFDAFVAYDESVKGTRPAILVVHEWWGLNDYSKMRARKLATLGYLAMAVDVFGNGVIAANPKEAQELTMPFYKDPQLAKSRLASAMKKIREFEQTDPKNIAAIGYCFGGYVVLNAAKLGADLKGVVSFHGGLGGAPVNKDLLTASVLICHGAIDQFVSQKDAEMLKHQLDSVGAKNSLKIYANATHAFTNPDATKLGKEFSIPIAYNPEADKDSWNDMKVFLDELFKKY